MFIPKKIISLLVFTVINLNGASQLTHAYLAKKWLDLNKKSDDYKAAFIRGTLFPDIRYYAKISREQTHDDGATLESISVCTDPFIAGKMFHTFVDETRVQIVKKSKILGTIEKILTTKALVLQKHKILLLKFAEDEILFNQYDKCLDVAQHLSSIDEPMRALKIPDQKLTGWYNLLKSTYFSGNSKSAFFKQTDLQRKTSIALTFKFSLEEFDSLEPTIQALAQDKKVQAYTKQLVRDFEDLFKKFLQEQNNN